ncbi:hypothetical protein B0H17DRAFT_455811 [Mycena rosella]|uniref:Uncharacterized protein n=1 Tax=Mycena rosella TaxID=1033263 RepID=A0AAD7DLU2_MYCRO|nr:hypothetical protein B0H17DRAFT_455811 [Mycena rosella]
MIPAVQAATSSGASLVENPAEKSGSIFSRLRKLSARHKDNNSESIAVPVAAEYSQPSVGNPAEAPRGEGAFSRLRKLSARVRKNNSSQSITVQAATEYSRPPVDNVAKTLGGESGGRDARGSDQFSESRTAVDSSAEPEDDLQPGLASGRSVVNGAGLKGKARVYEDMTPPDNRLSTPSLASQIHTSTSPSSPFHDAEADIVELYFADTRALSDPDAFRALQQQQRGRPNPDAGPSTGGGMFLSLRNRTKSILKKPDSQFGTMQAAMQSTPALGRPKKVSFSLPSFATRKRTSSTGAADQPSNYVQPVIKSPPPPAGKTTKESSGIVDYLRNRKRSITKGVPPGQKPSSGSGKMPTPFSEPLPSLNTPAEDPPSPPGDSLRAERPSASPQKPKTGTDNNMTSGPSGSLGTSPSTPNPPIRRKKSFHLPRLRPRTISAKAVESEQSVPSTSPRPLNPHAQEFIPQMTIVKKAEDGPLTVSESETTLATSPTSSSSVGSSTFDNVISPRAEDLSSAATTQNLGPRAGPVPEAASPAPSPTDTLVAKSYSDLYVPPHRRRKSAESGIFLKSTIPFPSSTEDTGPANGIGLTNEPGPANELGPTNDLGPANETGTVKETRPDDGTGLDDEVSGNETALANQPGTTESEEFTLKTDSKYSARISSKPP